jgi:hypothetical protein
VKVTRVIWLFHNKINLTPSTHVATISSEKHSPNRLLLAFFCEYYTLGDEPSGRAEDDESFQAGGWDYSLFSNQLNYGKREN